MTNNKLNYNFAANNRTGYSIASVNIGMQLSELDCDLTLFPIGGMTQEKNIYKWVLHNHYRTKLCDYKAKALRLWHQHDLYDFPICSERIGFPIFELNKFTAHELHSINSVDRLIVCSKWGKQVCVDNRLPETKISVCPLGVDTKIFSPRNKPPGDKYIFVNLGKAEVRKGHDILVEIFNKAFTKADNVELWLLPHNPFLTKEQEKEWLKLIKDSPLGYKIKIFPPLSTHEDVSNFICRADCAIFPHRAEGWGLENLESMACNLPVITTNYSGTSEYSTKDNSFLVDITEKEIANDGIFFHGQGEWAKIGNKEIDQFVDYMKYCYDNRINKNPEGYKTAKKFSWRNSAEILKEIIWEK